MIEFIKQLDTNLFLLINQSNNGFFDRIMIYASSIGFWIPFYLILLYLIIRQYKWQTIVIIIIAATAIAVSDLSSVYLFKNVFHRLRPCYEPQLIPLIHNIVGCGGKYGFVSSHASNSFVIVIFIIKVIGKKHNWLKLLMPLWGLVIIYSRIYLGKHYPSDVIVGALLGLIIGWLAYNITLRSINYLSNNSDNNSTSLFHSK